MKKFIVTTLILTLALFVFPLSSFAQESCIYPNTGDIEDLEFDFGAGFDLELPIEDGEGNIIAYFEATITKVRVEASGQELIVVTPKKQYIYDATLTAGWYDSEYGKVFAQANMVILDPEENPVDVTLVLVFEFDIASMFEQFKVKKHEIPAACVGKEVTVPKKVDLFFEVKAAQLTEIRDLDGDTINIPGFDPSYVDPFNLVLVIDKGKPAMAEVYY